MEPPLYPHRDFVYAGECGKQPLEDLRVWVQGGRFHRYGLAAYDREPIKAALERIRENPPILEFDGRLGSGFGGLNWSVRFRQAGDPDSWGLTSPHMTPEDAAYAALTLIEEHEREVYEQELVIGTA